MGKIYSFKCSLNAEVSGENDCDMLTETQTVFCEICQKLVDITTKERTNSQTINIPHKCPNCFN